MKKKLKVLDKNSHWWAREENTKWAIKDEEGSWWLVGGSEFPERKTDKKEKKMNCGLPPTFDFKECLLKIFYASLLGISLGLNIFFIINEVF